jgi:hypothetical protein
MKDIWIMNEYKFVWSIYILLREVIDEWWGDGSKSVI